MQNYIPNGNVVYQNQTGQCVQPIPAQQNCPQFQYATPPQNPNCAGVNIQIFNPMVNSGANGYIYPQQTTSAYASGSNGGCYPANYYTNQGYTNGSYPAMQSPNGFYDATGRFYPYVQDKNGQVGYYDNNGNFQPLSNPSNANNANNNSPENVIYDKNGQPHQKAVGPNGETGYYDEAGKFHPVDNNSNESEDNKKNGFYDENGKFHEYTTGPNGETGYYDENGRFNPLNKPDTGSDSTKSGDNQNTTNSNSDTKTSETNTYNPETKSEESTDTKKTEKRNVVILSDEYIKTLENYLNSQDVEVRKMGAHDVIARLEEDPSRKDNLALTALVNKMLQDPSSSIRALGLSTIEAGILSGDNKTVDILKKMQASDKGYGLDATQATSALLKMAAKTEEKEFEIKNSGKIKNK